MGSTFETVADIIADIGDVERDTIKPESHIMTDLEIDSLDFLDVTFSIDKKFNIKLPVEDWMTEVNEGDAQAEDYFVMEGLCSQIDKLRSEKAV